MILQQQVVYKEYSRSTSNNRSRVIIIKYTILTNKKYALKQ